MFYILCSWAVLHCWIRLLLHKTYLVGIVWLLWYGILISNICNDCIMIPQLLLTLFFTINKPNQTPSLNPFLVETAACELFIATFHQYSCLYNNDITLFCIISLNMLLSSARLESNCKSWYSKASRTYFLVTSHCIALYLHSEATMKPIAIQSQQEPLICMLTQQESLAVAQVVVSLLLSLLIYAFHVWEEVNVST